MTKESICMRCAELIRMRFKDFEEEERICGVGAIGTDIMGSGATVKECSRYVEVSGDKTKKN